MTARIDSAIKKILPQATVSIERGQKVDWVDVNLFGSEVTIECHTNDKFGVVVPHEPGFLKMADYYFDNHIEALDIAIKLLTE